MTIVEIVFTMIRATLIIAFFMVAIILIRRTFSKAKSGRNRVTVNFSAHCKVKNHFLEFYQAQ